MLGVERSPGWGLFKHQNQGPKDITKHERSFIVTTQVIIGVLINSTREFIYKRSITTMIEQIWAKFMGVATKKSGIPDRLFQNQVSAWRKSSK